jgi:hypothetical protein
VGSGSCRQELSCKCWTRHGSEKWRAAGGFATPACNEILDETNNPEQYQPGHSGVAVLRPGDLLLRVRDRLARLTDEGEL